MSDRESRWRRIDAEAGTAQPLWTSAEVAAYLKIPRKSVYRLVERRCIRVHRIGRTLRFLPTDVVLLLERSRVPSKDDE